MTTNQNNEAILIGQRAMIEADAADRPRKNLMLAFGQTLHVVAAMECELQRVNYMMGELGRAKVELEAALQALAEARPVTVEAAHHASRMARDAISGQMVADINEAHGEIGGLAYAMQCASGLGLGVEAEGE